jgi:hypothetical protein
MPEFAVKARRECSERIRIRDGLGREILTLPAILFRKGMS